MGVELEGGRSIDESKVVAEDAKVTTVTVGVVEACVTVEVAVVKEVNEGVNSTSSFGATGTFSSNEGATSFGATGSFLSNEGATSFLANEGVTSTSSTASFLAGGGDSKVNGEGDRFLANLCVARSSSAC